MDDQITENSSNSTDVDSILAEVSSQNEPGEIPMHDPQPDPQPKTQAEEFMLKVNGKEIKAPREKVLQWAQMGYAAPNEIGKYKSQLSEYEQKLKTYQDLENRWGQYKQLDDYIAQNPDWWNAVQSQYQTQQQELSNNPLVQKISTLESKLTEFEKFKSDLTTKELEQRQAAEDSQLDSEIQSIRKNYKDLDWDSVGADGKTLEYRVLEHANAKNIPSFKAAFLDLKHDELLKLAEERGKEAVSKDIQKRTKLGLLGKTPAPTKKLTKAENVKAKSYNDLLHEALDELRSGS